MDIPDDVYSHHDDECEDDIGQDDAGYGDGRFLCGGADAQCCA
jgi:hypothetical protein